MAVLIRTGTGTDESVVNFHANTWTGVASPYSANTVISATWTRYTATATLAATTNQLGISFASTPVGKADSDDSFYITGVQLEIGSVATPFEFRHYQKELALCQRYCYAITTIVAKENIAFGSAASTTVAYVSIFLPVEMRTVPTLTATAGDYQCDDGATAVTDVTALVIGDRDISNTKMVSLKATATFTAFRPYFFTGDATTARVLLLTAEL
jgi:hypothetical protein